MLAALLVVKVVSAAVYAVEKELAGLMAAAAPADQNVSTAAIRVITVALLVTVVQCG